jgi:phosphatidylserine/phosphatidylglycerophosphate/cardiolipin synthase-like enzyme
MKKKCIVLVVIGCVSWFVASFQTIAQMFFPSSNVSQEFGKTHFIVGFPHDELKKSSTGAQGSEQVLANVSCKQVLFSPDDNLTQELVRLIDHERKEIKIAVYTFTDSDIAEALLNAHERGVVVSLVTDPGYKTDRYSKIPLLQKAGITIFEYDPNHVQDMRSNLMHHKFVIFADTCGEPCLWTGSFNFTRSARERNQENAVIIKDPTSIERFEQQFERIKQHRCVGCKREKHKTRDKDRSYTATRRSHTKKDYACA